MPVFIRTHHKSAVNYEYDLYNRFKMNITSVISPLFLNLLLYQAAISDFSEIFLKI